MALITLSISKGAILPALRMIMFLSAVKIRKGRIKEFVGSEPEMKFVEYNASADVSFFTNLSMLNLLRVLSNLLPKQLRSRNGFLIYRFFRHFQKPDHPICEPMPTLIVHYFLTYYVLPTFPLQYVIFGKSTLNFGNIKRME